MRQQTKFFGDRSNRCRDMAIYHFFQYGGHPPFWICCALFWTTHEEHLVVFVVVQNLVFGWNRCSSFDIVHHFRFCPFGMKMPIFTPPKLAFLWI